MSGVLRLSAHLSLLYAELPFLRRLDAAARDGFEAVEFWSVSDPVGVGRRVRRLGLAVASLNVPAGEGAAACGRMGDRDAVRWWREQFAHTLEVACAIGCQAINLLAGVGTGGGDARSVLAENLAWALSQLADAPVALVLEPLNPRDRPGYLLPRVEDALSLRDAVGAPERVGILLDAYHVARGGGDPVAALARCGDALRHVQIADAPGRHEPGTGEVDFRAFLRAVAASGYAGWVGLEYEPTGDVAATARRIRALAAHDEEAACPT